jgi:hypothetical protein
MIKQTMSRSEFEGWCGLVVEQFLIMHEALSLIPSIAKKKKRT